MIIKKITTGYLIGSDPKPLSNKLDAMFVVTELVTVFFFLPQKHLYVNICIYQCPYIPYIWINTFIDFCGCYIAATTEEVKVPLAHC